LSYALLPAFWCFLPADAHAQLGLVAAGLAAATAQWVVLALILWVPIVVIGVLLYVVSPWLRPHQPRLRFGRALAYGVVIGVIMTYVLIGAWGYWQMQNLESQSSPCAEPALSPPQFLLVTALEGNGPCQSRPCVKRAFGKSMSGIEYVVKNAVGEALFIGKIDQDGNAIWFGDAPGQKVGIELYWQDLCTR
jgi:hypothetical protein